MWETLNEKNLLALIEGVKDYAILMLDPQGRVASWSACAERIKGYRTEEIVKGSGQSYGFSELTRLGRALEDSAKSADARAVQGLLEQLGDYLQRVQLVPSCGSSAEIPSEPAHRGHGALGLNLAPASADI